MHPTFLPSALESVLFPPEWYPQSAVQLTWPHRQTDWKEMLEEVLPCFVAIARAVLERESLVIVCSNAAEVRSMLGAVDEDRLFLYELPSNDTWARDHGAVSVLINGHPVIYDFAFNGWGAKFEATLDNKLTRLLFDEKKAYLPTVAYKDALSFVLEGGSIESDGAGTLLTTSECLLSKNRNDGLSEKEIESLLKTAFGLQRILWLRHGYLSGDDTDSHVDTLARFCDANTIAYVMPGDSDDEHTEALTLMQEELRALRTLDGKPYRLIPLPMADAVYHEGERLPATYANFLIINGAVLMPSYLSPKDEIAAQQLKQAFPNREIILINCLPLIRQHGSLHCLTMQYPEGFVASSSFDC
jgi:agmatine deiminase